MGVENFLASSRSGRKTRFQDGVEIFGGKMGKVFFPRSLVSLSNFRPLFKTPWLCFLSEEGLPMKAKS